MAGGKTPSLSSESRIDSISPKTSENGNKKGIFKKILNRRPASEKTAKREARGSSANYESSSLTSSQKSDYFPKQKKASKKHRGTDYLDNEDDIIYNFDEFDTTNRDSVSKVISDDSSSGASLDSAEMNAILSADKSGIGSTGIHDLDKIPFPSLANSSGTQNTISSDHPWSNLTYEYFKFPKYQRINKRNKNSPTILKNLFLAQELNYKGGKDESADVETSSEYSSNGSSIVDANDTSLNNESKGANVKQDTLKKDHKIFVMQFSKDGRYLATAGADTLIRIWRVISSPLGRLEYKNSERSQSYKFSSKKDEVYPFAPVFNDEPMKILRGHTDSVISLDWSKNNFLITGSMDKTVKLWHVDRDKCLSSFQHEDFTTSVNFHPTDDRFFLSGCLDNSVRLWSILEESIAYSVNLGDDFLITASSFTPDGNHCLVGGFNGSIVCLETKGLYTVSRYAIKEDTVIHPFHEKESKKINGIRIFENTTSTMEEVVENPLEKYNVLITTNDSKIRLVDPHVKSLVTRFKGLSNKSSSIVASVSDDHNYIISGSEDHWCYIWENNNGIINNKLNVALAEFTEEKAQSLNKHQKHKKLNHLLNHKRLIKNMSIKELIEKGQNTNYIANENNSYASFHAHHSKVNAALFAPQSTKSLLAASDDIIYDLMKRGKTVKDDTKSSKRHADRRKDSDDKAYDNIIVTTDNFGLIRVFRQDCAFQSRKRLIQYHKNSKDYAEAIRPKQKPTEATENSKDNHNDCIPRLKSHSLYNRSLSPSYDASALKSKIHSKFKSAGSSSSVPISRSHYLKADYSSSRGNSVTGDETGSNSISLPTSSIAPLHSDSDATKKSQTGIFVLDGAFMDVTRDEVSPTIANDMNFSPLQGSNSTAYDVLSASASTSVDLDLNKDHDGNKLEHSRENFKGMRSSDNDFNTLGEELEDLKIKRVSRSESEKKKKKDSNDY